MEYCKQEGTIRELIEFKGATTTSLKNIEESIDDIKNNHLAHIYKDIKCILDKISKGRPSWAVSWIITTLTSVCGILLTALIVRLWN